MRLGQAFHDGILKVTKDWATVQKKRIRDQRRGQRAEERYFRGYRDPSIRDLAFEVMQSAYLKASGQGRYPAPARQIMYAARALMKPQTEREVDDRYFTQTLLPDYVRSHPRETATWDVIFDARGHFTEPHTGTEIALGTLQVRKYLRDRKDSLPDAAALYEKAALKVDFPTKGPQYRYATVLFVEKEGFKEIFEAAKLQERYDLAIMSTKGLSTVAARTLVDRLRVRFLVLHDFDVYGFSILGTIRRNTERYRFRFRPEVIDLGLRFSDVVEEGLEPEPVSYGRAPNKETLRRNGATEEEIAWMVDEEQRVELNALTSDQLIDWIERKLEEHGVEKVVPVSDVLTVAYKRAVYVHAVNAHLAKIQPTEQEKAEQAEVPADLEEEVHRRLDEDPALSWDGAVAQIAEAALDVTEQADRSGR